MTRRKPQENEAFLRFIRDFVKQCATCQFATGEYYQGKTLIEGKWIEGEKLFVNKCLFWGYAIKPWLKALFELSQRFFLRQLMHFEICGHLTTPRVCAICGKPTHLIDYDDHLYCAKCLLRD